MPSNYVYFNQSQMECVSRYAQRCRRKRSQWPFAIRCSNHHACQAYGTKLALRNITVQCPPCRAVFDIDDGVGQGSLVSMSTMCFVACASLLLYVYLQRRRWLIRYS